MPAHVRQKWLDDASAGFVASAGNKAIFRIILEHLWPLNHGVPGPQVTEEEIRAAINAHRLREGKDPYLDVFRRLRELQGEEGFTGIVKEGKKYQLQSLTIGPKRIKREKPSKADWDKIRAAGDFRCAHCGASEPEARLSPDHKVPRLRGGSNDLSNYQPLCEQCNNLKSSACRGCTLNCYVCPWAYPETYKDIIIDDENREKIKRYADKKSLDQSAAANTILKDFFNKAGI